MALRCGIVGLPNVGKSTLMNALTGTIAAEAANYPFCTIEPNEGVVAVPDERLRVLADMEKSGEIVPARLSFVDIAGLVRGASKGEGLGNQFLAHIRETDAIIHVVRCFDDAGVVHVEKGTDPIRDIGIINTELMLADLESLERRIPAVEKKARGGDREAALDLEVTRAVLEILSRGAPARDYVPKDEERKRAFRMLQMLSAKPVLYVCNVGEAEAASGNEYSRRVLEYAGNATIVSAKIEQEVSVLSEGEKKEFMDALGLSETGLSRVIKSAYSLLGLITFFTAGPKESHAWTVVSGTRAPRAAGEIHSDFERGFIRAETVSYGDFVRFGGERGARENGRLRIEGKDYVVQDGDIFRFLFN
ncbi:MAG: redox-regulated ATPase YchF [Rickettsiales bacterium]|jgi:GTP-binding protein YchF|nr:redox-regulated ATPase YchF [Rickettsiales bacterium]